MFSLTQRSNFTYQHGMHLRAMGGHRKTHTQLLPHQPPSSSRCVHARLFQKTNDDLAERTKEVWDDVEDIQAAVKKLGWDEGQQGADSGPLLSQINQLYVEKNFPKAFIGQLELRYMEGKGYGLVATKDISKGQLLAISPPLAWVSGPPGTAPRLDTLISHIAHMPLSAAQVDVLHCLCSLPALDDAHEQQQQRRQQQQRKDRLLRAAGELEAAAPGAAVSSLPVSKSAALKRMQRQLQLQQRADDLGFDDGILDEDEDEDDYDNELHEDEDGIEHRYGRFGSSSSSSRGIVRSSISSRNLAGRPSSQQRRTPDLFELLECVKVPDDATDAAAAAAAAGVGTFNQLQLGTGSSRSSRSTVTAVAAAGAGAASRGQQLQMPPDRVTALVCRNALMEMCQDLPVLSGRGDKPASITGLWPLLTAFNHSCAPNAMAVVVGDLSLTQTPPEQQQKAVHGKQATAGRAGNGRAAKPAPTAGPVNPWAAEAQRKDNMKRQASAATAGSSSSTSATASSQSLTLPGGSMWPVSTVPGVGPFVLVRAVTDLSAGDEVTLDYLSPFAEGSLVHRERRKAALAQRWGFTCRCERCTAEEKLGTAVERTQTAANSLAARLGPKVSAAAAAGDKDTLAAAAAALSSAVQQLDRQVNEPTIPARVAAWAHASVYQAHALLAIARMSLNPSTMSSLAAIGTAMELAGVAVAGGTSHLLGAAALLVASHDHWGDGDPRVEATERGLLEVLQLRYGPLEASVSYKLALCSTHWAQQLIGARLGLVAPSAAAAARARAALAAAAAKEAAAAKRSKAGKKSKSAAASATAAAAAGVAAGSSAAADDEVDELAAALELEAEEVLEVTEEVLEEFYPEEDDRSAASSTPEQEQRQQLDEDEVIVKQRSEQQVLQELQLFAGYAAALPPEQRRARLQQQQQQQQEQQKQVAASPDMQQKAQAVSKQSMPAAPGSSAGAAAAGAAPASAEGEEAAPAVSTELPMLASWLSEVPGETAADTELPEDRQQPNKPTAAPAGVATLPPAQQAAAAAAAAGGAAAGAGSGVKRSATSSSSAKLAGKSVKSLFAKGESVFGKQPSKPQQQQQQQQQQQVPSRQQPLKQQGRPPAKESKQ